MAEERRKEERIPIDKLPECLKVIYFKVGEFGEFSAKTINASKSGMSFASVGVFENNPNPGEKITIKIKPENIKLQCEIIHSNVLYIDEIGMDLLKFGVKIKTGKSLKKYHDLISECIT